ncbi:MAG: type II toxin-antitoxin system RelE/ParE family toxin [Pseudomonadota bacterium]
MALRFTKAAEDDLLSIFVEGILEFGEAQAERYKASIDESLRFIEANPLAVRERNEIAPPVRIHRSGVHMIIFTVENDDVLVIRVRHGSEDWLNDPVGE